MVTNNKQGPQPHTPLHTLHTPLLLGTLTITKNNHGRFLIPPYPKGGGANFMNVPRITQNDDLEKNLLAGAHT